MTHTKGVMPPSGHDFPCPRPSQLSIVLRSLLHLKRGESLIYGTRESLTYGTGKTLTPFEVASEAWKRSYLT